METEKINQHTTVYKPEFGKNYSTGYGTSMFYDSTCKRLYFSVIFEPNTIRLCAIDICSGKIELIKGMKGMLRSAVFVDDSLYMLHTHGIAVFNNGRNEIIQNIKKSVGTYNWKLHRVCDDYLGITSKCSKILKLFSPESSEVVRKVNMPWVDLFWNTDKIHMASFWYGEYRAYDYDFRKILSKKIITGKDTVYFNERIFLVEGRRSNDNSPSPGDNFIVKSLEVLVEIDVVTLEVVRRKHISGLQRVLGVNSGNGMLLALTESSLLFISMTDFSVINEIDIGFSFVIESVVMIDEYRIALLPVNMSTDGNPFFAVTGI